MIPPGLSACDVGPKGLLLGLGCSCRGMPACQMSRWIAIMLSVRRYKSWGRGKKLNQALLIWSLICLAQKMI